MNKEQFKKIKVMVFIFCMFCIIYYAVILNWQMRTNPGDFIDCPSFSDSGLNLSKITIDGVILKNQPDTYIEDNGKFNITKYCQFNSEGSKWERPFRQSFWIVVIGIIIFMPGFLWDLNKNKEHWKNVNKKIKDKFEHD